MVQQVNAIKICLTITPSNGAFMPSHDFHNIPIRYCLISFQSESYENNVVYMSPGTSFSDDQSFYQELHRAHYKLPEFPTSFLLARKIELEFSDVSQDVVTATMSETTSASSSVRFLCFNAHASYSKNKQTSHSQVQRTSNGMKISIPGAQMIGYYTQVLPKFPQKQ